MQKKPEHELKNSNYETTFLCHFKGLQTKFGQLYVFYAIFLLPLIRNNSAAVNSVWNFHKNVVLYFQLFVISIYQWLILDNLSPSPYLL